MTITDKSALPAKPDTRRRTKAVADSGRKAEDLPSPSAREPFSLPWNLDQALAAADEQSNAMLDRMIGAATARSTLGVSPEALSEAFGDWLSHLARSPGKQGQLVQKAVRKLIRLWLYTQRYASDPNAEACIDPLPQDQRFTAAEWRQWPFNLYYQSFLLTQQWWYNATTGVRGVSRHHEEVVNFVTRQLLDILSPSNFLLTNPEILNQTLEQGGSNLYRGFLNFVEDWERAVAGRPPVGAEKFRAGKEVAITSGKVVFRNRLIELIQYAPTTESVHAEPLLVVPAWIMKYYILDLSPHNSLVKYLVDKGHTVFMISWRNPDADERDLGMEDYIHLGIEAALKAVAAIVPDRKVHGVGYCLGGTLLAIAAAARARDDDQPFASLSLLATQTDFTEAGELMLFIDEGEVSFLEDMMWEQGYLDTKQMAGAFQLLRSNDLIWSRLQREYLLGERRPLNDLMAWNADATRMPFRMHSEYLRHLFLDNDLAEGRYQVEGRPVTVNDIRLPIFSVATLYDHVAPWHSVYKINLLTDTTVTFLLTTGGHNAGIVSEPGHPRRSYQVATRKADDKNLDPDSWRAMVPTHDGSWWPAWQDWLAERSVGEGPPPVIGAPQNGYPDLGDAPGTYVLQP